MPDDITAEEIAKMHEIFFYLDATKNAMTNEDVEPEARFNPKWLVVAVKLPSGAVELDINSSNILEKIEYYFEAYNTETLALHANPDVVIQNILVV